MGSFLTHVLLALGIITTPIQDVTEFVRIGASPAFEIEVDMKSLFIRQHNGGYEVSSTLRLKLFQERVVEGAKKKGSYFIDSVTAICRDDKLVLNSATLYAEDGEALATSTQLGAIKNPRIPGNFITDYLDVVCNDAKKFKPALMI
jgi:hypothetical protein